MDSIKSQLVDMGFSEGKIDKAIASCPEAKTLEQIMEWMIAHESEIDSTNSATAGESNRGASSTGSGPNTSTITSSTKSHNDSSQSEGFRPDETAAEAAARRKITVEEAQRLIDERRAIRAEEERKKEIEDEKKRRVDGQKMIQTRAELEDQERIRLAQQIRQEKLEKEMHKKRVLEQIALDRANMKSKTVPGEQLAAKAPAPGPALSVPSSAQTKTPSNECKIALRFPDGTSKVQKFSPQEQLAAVRLFVHMEKPSAPTANIEFVAPPNRKFTESMMKETLDSLGLCPASRLEVKMNSIHWADLE